MCVKTMVFSLCSHGRRFIGRTICLLSRSTVEVNQLDIWTDPGVLIASIMSCGRSDSWQSDACLRCGKQLNSLGIDGFQGDNHSFAVEEGLKGKKKVWLRG